MSILDEVLSEEYERMKKMRAAMKKGTGFSAKRIYLKENY